MGKFKIKLDEIERGIVIRALNDLRTKQLEENKPTEPVNELLMKFIDD